MNNPQFCASIFDSADPFDPEPFTPELTTEGLVADLRFWSLIIGNWDLFGI